MSQQSVIPWSALPFRSPRAAAGRANEPRRHVHVQTVSAYALGSLLATAVAACDPTLIVGRRYCAEPPAEGGATPNPSSYLDPPWSTGFEDGFCAYAQPTGFCYTTGDGSYAVVTSPTHTGRYAAAFSANSDVEGSQVRCVEQGVFPESAYYGAWYYVPESAVNSGLWNLLHFQGGVPGGELHGLWDVSLVNGARGDLRISVFDFVSGSTAGSSSAPPIPIREWFQLEVYFKRSKEKTGEISVWQDGVSVARLTDVVTDDTDWGQWYVGNLATELSPPTSTVYVDDVSIRSSR